MLRAGNSYARLASADGDESHEDFVRIEAQWLRRLRYKDDAGEGNSVEDWNESVSAVSVCYRA